MNKKAIIFIASIAILIGLQVQAQSAPTGPTIDVFKVSSSTITPRNASNTFTLPYLGSSGNPCTTVNAAGKFATSTCGSGGAGTPTSTINGFTGIVYDLLGTSGEINRVITNGSTTFSLSTTTVSAGSYTYTGLTVDSKGRITSASNGGTPLLVSNNLSDLTSTSTAQTNLGLGSSATHPSTDYLASSTNLAPSTTIPTIYVTTLQGLSGTLTILTSTQARTWNVTSSGSNIRFIIPPANDQYFAPSTTIATNNSQLTNGSGFITTSTNNFGGITTSTITIGTIFSSTFPLGLGLSITSTGTLKLTTSAISQFNNDSTYLTTSTGLTTGNFTSANISQWTNNMGLSSTTLTASSSNIELAATGNNYTVGVRTNPTFGSLVVSNSLTVNSGGVQLTRASGTLSNGANNNVAIPANVSYVTFTGPSAAYSVTGFANAFDGRVLIVYFNIAQTLTIAYDSGSSSAGQRITTATGADVVLAANKPARAIFVYDQSVGAGAGYWVLYSIDDGGLSGVVNASTTNLSASGYISGTIYDPSGTKYVTSTGGSPSTTIPATFLSPLSISGNTVQIATGTQSQNGILVAASSTNYDKAYASSSLINGIFGGTWLTGIEINTTTLPSGYIFNAIGSNPSSTGGTQYNCQNTQSSSFCGYFLTENNGTPTNNFAGFLINNSTLAVGSELAGDAILEASTTSGWDFQTQTGTFRFFIGGTGASTTASQVRLTLSSTTLLINDTVSSTVISALWLAAADGTVSAYGGASACAAGQAVTTISAVGATTCAAFASGSVITTSTLGSYTSGNIFFALTSSTVSADATMYFVSSTKTFNMNGIVSSTQLISGSSSLSGQTTLASATSTNFQASGWFRGGASSSFPAALSVGLTTIPSGIIFAEGTSSYDFTIGTNGVASSSQFRSPSSTIGTLTVTSCTGCGGSGAAAATSSYWRNWEQTYTSVNSTTLNVTDASNGSSSQFLLSAGRMLKFKMNGVVKEAIVTSSSYNGGSSTVSIVGDSATGTTFSQFMYANTDPLKPTSFNYPGAIGGVASDTMGRYYVPFDVKLITTNCYNGTQGSSTAYYLDVNTINGATSTRAISCTIAANTSSSLWNTSSTASSMTASSTSQYLSMEITAVGSSTAIDAYIQVYLFPINNIYLF